MAVWRRQQNGGRGNGGMQPWLAAWQRNQQRLVVRGCVGGAARWQFSSGVPTPLSPRCSVAWHQPRILLACRVARVPVRWCVPQGQCAPRLGRHVPCRRRPACMIAASAWTEADLRTRPAWSVPTHIAQLHAQASWRRHCYLAMRCRLQIAASVRTGSEANVTVTLLRGG